MSFNVGHHIDHACWQLCETFLEGTFAYCWIVKLFPSIVVFAIVLKPLWQDYVPLHPLGITNYPWEILGLDLVTGLYGPKKIFTTIF